MQEDRILKEKAGRMIDVETCEIEWCFAQTLDPYGIEPDLPDDLWQVGRSYFVRSAESDGWVCAYDLPEDKRRALYARIKRGDVGDGIPF